ncbi:MAG: DUF120 domain-containing protein [Candidatus Marsarchaeota archaeon]|nr:DUF120 domain-containing protein [Candidatus Marsarchaeota archaeon]
MALKRKFLDESGKRWFDHADVVVALVEFGGLHGYVRISGSSLGSMLEVSQQAASRKLSRAVEAGLVDKRTGSAGFEYTVSEFARGQLRRFLNLFTAPLPRVELGATVVSGVGEGRFFLELRGYGRQFELIYGFKPYLGTLNLKADQNAFDVFRMYPSKIVNGFRTGNRRFGLVLTYPAILRLGSQVVECVALFPEYSRYGDDVVELIAPFSIKKKLGIADGTRVLVTPVLSVG